MIKYFKDLLETLKKIERHLEKLSKCVKERHHRHGDQASVSTKHWNE
jgi:hypothetical protein